MQRYENPSGNDAFRSLINKYVMSGDRILIPGCGSSRMTEELVADGFSSVKSIDSSYTVIKSQ